MLVKWIFCFWWLITAKQWWNYQRWSIPYWLFDGRRNKIIDDLPLLTISIGNIWSKTCKKQTEHNYGGEIFASMTRNWPNFHSFLQSILFFLIILRHFSKHQNSTLKLTGLRAQSEASGTTVEAPVENDDINEELIELIGLDRNNRILDSNNSCTRIWEL